MKRRWCHLLIHGAGPAVIVSAAAWGSAWAQVAGDGAAGELPVIEARRIGYSVRHWTVEDGLPLQSVTSLAQTTDGFLWCGTFGGLARFDGFEFKVFDENNTPELADLEIQELRADSRGGLWILGLNGDLARLESGDFRRFRAREDPGLPSRGVSERLSVSPGGVLWFRERNRPGYYRFGNGGFENVGGAGWPGQAMDGVVANDESLEWGILARDRTICRFGIDAQPTAPEKLEAPHGTAWLGVGRFFRRWSGTPAATSNQGIYSLRDGAWNLERAFPLPLAIGAGKAPLDGAEDPYGVFWVGTYELGVTASLPDGRMAHVALGNPDQNRVRSLLCDRDGNVWVAKEDGLFRMRRTVFQNWSAADGLQGSGISSIAVGAEGVWMLTSERGILHHLDSQSRSLDSIPGLEAGSGGQLAVESDGSVLVGTGSGEIWRYFDDGFERVGIIAGGITALHRTQDGTLWVGSKVGLWRRQEGNFQLERVVGAGLEEVVLGLAEDPNGTLHALVAGHGVFRKQGESGTWEKLGTPTDGPMDETRAIHIDAGGTLWLAGHAPGISCWKDGRWCTFPTLDRDLPRLIKSVVSDRQNGLWLGSSAGVCRIDRGALLEVADGRVREIPRTMFDRSNGLGSVVATGHQTGIALAPDRGIWVATRNGAARLDRVILDVQQQLASPPPARIERILVDDTIIMEPSAGASVAPIELAPGARLLQIDYAATNLSSPERTRFRFRLLGRDDDWEEVGAHTSAYYHLLPPGKYRFEVVAADAINRWSAAAAVKVVVQPAWWQRTSSRIAGVIAIVLVVSTAVFLRLRAVEKRRLLHQEFSHRLIASQEDERKRIAAELHDGLGQDLLLIKTSTERAAMKLDKTSPLLGKIEEVSELASRAIEDARTIMAGLRPTELDRLGLRIAVEEMARKVAANSEVEVACTVDDLAQPWSPEEEINIYRVVQLCLSNALKHAQAGRISVGTSTRNGRVRLVLQDDGKGMDSVRSDNRGDRAGLGLTGMQERLSILGGAMKVRSSPESGTEVVIMIPLPQPSTEDG